MAIPTLKLQEQALDNIYSDIHTEEQYICNHSKLFDDTKYNNTVIKDTITTDGCTENVCFI